MNKTKQCKKCGKTFSFPPYQKRKYCSLKCAWADHDRVLNSIKKNSKRVKKPCAYCGKIFERPKSQAKRPFCSVECGKKSLKRKVRWVDRTCKVCGKKFQVKDYKLKTQPAIYCSWKCKQSESAEALHTPEARLKSSKTRIATGSYSAKHQYSRCARGKREDLGNIFFRSAWEANYARYLNFANIKWEYEPKTFWFEGIKRGCRSYTPDFYLPEEDRYVEVKGWMDKNSRTKLKRMAKYYPTINIELIDKKRYQKIAEWKKIIPGWE